MSMMGTYCMVDREKVDGILDGELEASEVIFFEDDDDCGDDYDGEGNMLSIEKAWQAIAYVLTKGADESRAISRVVFGREVSDEEIGYAPATYITEEEVKEIAEEIEGIGKEDFRARFDFKGMRDEDVYLVADVPDDEEEEVFDYVWENFRELKEFYKKAAMRNKCLLFFVE